jgi:hypothetical protein
MLVGTRMEKDGDTSRFDREIKELKGFYGVKEQRLETLLIGGDHSAIA